MTNKMSKLALVAAISVASLSADYKVEITKIEDVASPYNGLFRIDVEDDSYDRARGYRSGEELNDAVYDLRGLLPNVEKVAPKCNLPLVMEAKKLLGENDSEITSEHIVNAPKVLQLLNDALGVVDFASSYGYHFSGEPNELADPSGYFSDCVSDIEFSAKDLVEMNAALSGEDVSVIGDIVKRAMKAISIPVVRDTLEEAKKKFSDDFFTFVSKDNAVVCLHVVGPLLELESHTREFLTEEEIKRASSTRNLLFRVQCKFDLATGGEGLPSPFVKHKDYAIRTMKDLYEFVEPIEEMNQKELVDEDKEPLKYAIISTRNLLDILEERGRFS